MTTAVDVVLVGGVVDDLYDELVVVVADVVVATDVVADVVVAEKFYSTIRTNKMVFIKINTPDEVYEYSVKVVVVVEAEVVEYSV